MATGASRLLGEGRDLFKAGKYADAQAKAEQAIAKLPSDAALHEFRALTLFAQGKYQDASAALYAVLAAGPGWNWETMRDLYGDPAEYTKQLRALEQFVKGKPDAGYGHFLLAYHYLVLGSKDAAVTELRQVTRIASAISPYEITGHCFSRMKWSSTTRTAHFDERTSPPMPSSVVAEAMRRWCEASSRA